MKVTPFFTGLMSILTLSAMPALSAPMDIADIGKIQTAGGLTVAPDGETIAYTVSAYPNLSNGDDDGGSVSQLYVKRQGQSSVLFTTAKSSVSRATFGSNGKQIYFLAKRDDDETNALYSISLNGGEASRLFQHSKSIVDYAVSPDGRTLYFVAKKQDDSKIDLSAKGFNAVVYEEDRDMAAVWKVSLSDDEAEATEIYSTQHVTELELTHSGKSLVIAAVPTALVDDFYMKKRLHIIDAATGRVKSEVKTPGKLGAFKVSPDDRRIAFLAGTDVHDTSDGVLMVADMATGSFQQLTPNLLQHIEDLDWLDADSILANAHRGVETSLVAYSITGEEEAIFSTPSDVAIRNIEPGADGKVFFIADSPKHPREVFVSDQNRVTKLTHINKWLDEIDLAPQTTFKYTARDGREVEGLLITPNSNKPAKGWPLILTVHGGPEAHYSDGWLTSYSTAGQFGAGDGYAVFYPNYRGSTGRGVAFSKEHQNDYAGKEFNDLVDGVKALAAAGIVDEDRVGITGGSYGGYASMWGATALSEHFAASVAFVGISNQVSKFGTSDIPNEMHLVHSLKWPWEDNWMNLIERSPVYHAGKSTTPTLILHGAKDTRVHPSQSMELYRSMKVRTDTPVRLVFYPNEGHGNRKAASRLDYAYRLMCWMDTYLADGNSRDATMPEFDIGISEKLGWDAEE